MKLRQLVIYLIPFPLAVASLVCGAADRVIAPMSDQDRLVMDTEGVASAHPDYRWRRDALLALEEGRHDLAQKYLFRAARYADKPSQALIAERYWRGDGVPQDRALAYAWMDLAAERGYTHFLVHRERYWSQMTAAERQSALNRGIAIYDEFGDDVAMPRKEKRLIALARKSTGSRLGSRLALEVYHAPARNPSGGAGIGKLDTNQFYLGAAIPRYNEDRFWRVEDYWQWQDEQYVGLPEGSVEVGDIESEK